MAAIELRRVASSAADSDSQFYRKNARKSRTLSAIPWPSSGSSPEMTATASAPASITSRPFSPVMPPIATSGSRVSARAAFTPSSPTTGSGFSFEPVAKTGPIAR